MSTYRPSSPTSHHHHDQHGQQASDDSAIQTVGDNSSSSKPKTSSNSNPVNMPTSSTFTPEMRDRQARGKDPYSPEGGDRFDRGLVSLRKGSASDKLDFASQEKRANAVAMLDNPELLMIYAQTTGDSIPAARLHFMKLMCGYDDEPFVDDSYRAGASSSRNRREVEKRKANR